MRVFGAITKAVFGLIVALLWIRFAVKLFYIAPASTFTGWTLRITDVFLWPFSGLFPPIALVGRYVLEPLTLFAIVVYEFIKFILVRMFRFIHGEPW